MVDDRTIDNSINLIKELMTKDPRIILIQNEENKSTFYSKAKGILNAKGKFVMTLDEDDLFAQKDALSTLYKQARKYNLDILGFYAINGGLPIDDRKNVIGSKQNEILFQPNVSKLMFSVNNGGKIEMIVNVLWIFF